MTRSVVLCLSCVLLLAGCATRSVVTETSVQGGVVDPGAWTRDELYLGMNTPTGVVSDSAFGAFLDREVAPRLPDGFTVLQATGYYRDTSTGRTVREPSRVLLVYYRDNEPQSGRALAELAALYKRLFQQQSVLRVTARVRASF